jgi:hypothetical protein
MISSSAFPSRDFIATSITRLTFLFVQEWILTQGNCSISSNSTGSFTDVIYRNYHLMITIFVLSSFDLYSCLKWLLTSTSVIPYIFCKPYNRFQRSEKIPEHSTNVPTLWIFLVCDFLYNSNALLNCSDFQWVSSQLIHNRLSIIYLLLLYDRVKFVITYQKVWHKKKGNQTHLSPIEKYKKIILWFLSRRSSHHC